MWGIVRDSTCTRFECIFTKNVVRVIYLRALRTALGIIFENLQHKFKFKLNISMTTPYLCLLFILELVLGRLLSFPVVCVTQIRIGKSTGGCHLLFGSFAAFAAELWF